VYVTIRSYKASPDLADAFAQREDDIRQLITGIDGFRAYHMIRTGDGGVATVSVYEDQAGAEESTRQAREWVQENLPGVATSPPEVISGEAFIDA
jgi:heme-degrading monooxygenase HmoA